MKPESAIQRDVRRYLALKGIDSVAVPNGAHLAGDKTARLRQMSAMKADGLMPGFPDLLLYPRFVNAIGHVEVKTEGGRSTPAQATCHAWLRSLGHRVAIVRSVDDMAETLAEWGWLPSDPDVAIIGDVTARVLSNLERAA